MVILVVPGRNLSEELTLNLEFSPLCHDCRSRIQVPQVENCTCFELTSLVKRFGKEKRTASAHVTFYLYMYTIYIYIIYIYYMCLSVCFCKYQWILPARCSVFCCYFFQHVSHT